MSVNPDKVIKEKPITIILPIIQNNTDRPTRATNSKGSLCKSFANIAYFYVAHRRQVSSYNANVQEKQVSMCGCVWVCVGVCGP